MLKTTQILSTYGVYTLFLILPEHHEAVLGGPIISSYRVAEDPSERAETGGHQSTGTDQGLYNRDTLCREHCNARES